MNQLPALLNAVLVICLLAFIAAACDSDDRADVNDEQQRQQIEEEVESIGHSFEERKAQTTRHLDEARIKIDEAVDDAENVAQEAFDIPAN